MKGQDPGAWPWTNFNLACHTATRGRPEGELHVVGVLERGPHGKTLATVASCRSSSASLEIIDPARFTFETADGARSWATWVMRERKSRRNLGG